MSESKHDHDVLPPQKRQRMDSDACQRKQRSEYWFEDGNVVLEAEDTLFRVHRSVLSRSSKIFEDTFAMPQPPSQSQENDCIDGCPVVLLSDTAEDIGNLISLLYDCEKTLDFGSQIPGKTLGSMIRLGRKYDIPYLENKALASLRENYPTTLRAWDERYEDDLDTITEHISVAHEFDLFTILPAAYATYLQHKYLIEIPNDVRIPEKARSDCIIGFSRIQGFVKKYNVDALCPPLFLPSKECSGGSKCEKTKWTTIKGLRVWIVEECRIFGIFEPWVQGIATEWLCPQCQTEAKNLTAAVRSKMWAALPTLFGLPQWSNLKDGD